MPFQLFGAIFPHVATRGHYYHLQFAVFNIAPPFGVLFTRTRAKGDKPRGACMGVPLLQSTPLEFGS